MGTIFMSFFGFIVLLTIVIQPCSAAMAFNQDTMPAGGLIMQPQPVQIPRNRQFLQPYLPYMVSFI